MPFYETAPFWVAVAFLIVVGAAFKKVSRALTNGLDVRAAKIKSTLDEARQLREDAQALLAEYQRKQRDALKEAEEILTVAKEESKRLKAKAKKDMEETVKRREKQALDRIAQAEAQATAEVRNLVVNIAISATRTVIAESLTAAQADSLIDESIKGLSKKLN
ncbi:MAG: F0F1 ATP synthase subunit B [Alphaproteobacteria bacterium RIFOXYD12_FULL_60_8]|nr:MAG: F0F1 ATP synthase subunit B [Alphaproteobacteria bacterium RIFOXYD12_FULL_60_8]